MKSSLAHDDAFTALATRLDQEIEQAILPHIRGEIRADYPFQSSSMELFGAGLHKNLDTELHVKMLDHLAHKMTRETGFAFRYAAFREVDTLLCQLLRLANRKVPPEARFKEFGV